MVYFIQEQGSGMVKVGYTMGGKPALLSRLSKLQSSNPRALVAICAMPGGAVEEQAYHRRFASQHVRGEWYAREGALDKFMRKNALRRPVRIGKQDGPKMVSFRRSKRSRFRGDRWHPLDAILGD